MPDILLIGQANVSAGFLPKIQAEVVAIRSIMADKATKYVDPRELTFTAKSLSEVFNNPLISDNIKFLHYAGHSSQKGISFQENGEAKLMLKDNLVAFLKNQHLRFVFLNSCLSENIAQDLHAVGVPIVIGTTAKVGDEDAVKIAKQFYSTLAGMPGRTLLQAFEDTTTYFRNNPDELQQNYVFRGLGSDEDTSQDFAWNIYAENAPEAVKNWCLIPAKNLLLSQYEGAGAKVFCFYPQNRKKLYAAIKPHEQTDFKGIMNGIWEIGDDFSTADLQKECEAADYILHFLDTDYAALQDSINRIPVNALSKKHIFIELEQNSSVRNYVKTKEFFQFNENDLIPTSAQQGILTLFGKPNLNAFALEKGEGSVFEFFKSELIKRLQETQIDGEKLAKDLEGLDFEREKTAYDLSVKPNLFFSLIEGTDNCIQNLLVKSIKNRLQKNSKVPQIPFSNRSEDSVELLWMGLYKHLLNSSQAGDGQPLEEIQEEVVKEIFKKVNADENVIIVFENIEKDKDLYEKEIIEKLWPNITAEYERRLTKWPNFVLKRHIMIFCINYQYDKNNAFKLPEHGKGILKRFSPVSPLFMEQFAEWYATQKNKYQNYSPFNELNFNKFNLEEVELEGQARTGVRRKKAIFDICTTLKCKDIGTILQRIQSI
jgi:hypothetical protein